MKRVLEAWCVTAGAMLYCRIAGELQEDRIGRKPAMFQGKFAGDQEGYTSRYSCRTDFSYSAYLSRTPTIRVVPEVTEECTISATKQ